MSKKRRKDDTNLKDLSVKNTEELKMIRTNIGFINKDIKTMMFTSYSPAEGKSTLIGVMAEVFAQQGKKVLIIDADFRRPTQNKKFKLLNQAGLSTYLQRGVDESWEGLVQDTLFKDVYLLPAGPIPPNPTELADSDKFKEMLEQAKEIFDLVLIDAPPAGISDTKILSSRAEGVVFIVEDNRVKKAQFQNALEVLEQAGANILGIVLNKVKRSKKDSAYYYYNY
ncbi:CpsD/CapB family tyrosine-protein kinase [Listeria rustica]|uniref:non-specific protein-tyrosine kinase n=1 Tax=Listeria rustica TaxID=2713503 RepID=A0A7W1T4Y0_9LIST|nr:CpsD/CapB family tyrosine-protein kinase [Listeria rustica]MBA3925601.1 CpsD/CapB family tyrosine-protein kinase [Listeria rustica]